MPQPSTPGTSAPRVGSHTRKVMVVPYARIGSGDAARDCVLVLRDTKSSDLTFVSGGIKNLEDQVDAANRELKEETHGVLELDIRTLPRVAYTMVAPSDADGRRAPGAPLTHTYFVFVVDVTDVLNGFKGGWPAVRRAYEDFDRATAKPEECETNGILATTLHALREGIPGERLWTFVRDHFVNDQRVADAVDELSDRQRSGAWRAARTPSPHVRLDAPGERWRPGPAPAGAREDGAWRAVPR